MSKCISCLSAENWTWRHFHLFNSYVLRWFCDICDFCDTVIAAALTQQCEGVSYVKEEEKHCMERPPWYHSKPWADVSSMIKLWAWQTYHSVILLHHHSRATRQQKTHIGWKIGPQLPWEKSPIYEKVNYSAYALQQNTWKECKTANSSDTQFGRVFLLPSILMILGTALSMISSSTKYSLWLYLYSVPSWCTKVSHNKWLIKGISFCQFET